MNASKADRINRLAFDIITFLISQNDLTAEGTEEALADYLQERLRSVTNLSYPRAATRRAVAS